MYVIRTLDGPQHLDIEISGTIDEAEVLRMISQASAIAATDGAQYVLCEFSGVTGFAADPYVLAAALAASGAPVRRIACVTAEATSPVVRQAIRLAALSHATRQFDSRAGALGWLRRCAAAAARTSTALRHSRSSLDGARLATPSNAGPAAAARITAA